jgi:hypothetical protein
MLSISDYSPDGHCIQCNPDAPLRGLTNHLERALEVPSDAGGMFSLATFRVCKPDCGSDVESGGPIVTHIGPRLAPPGFIGVGKLGYVNWTSIRETK